MADFEEREGIWTEPEEVTDPVNVARRIDEFRKAGNTSQHAKFGLCAKCRHMDLRVHQDGAYTRTVAECDHFSPPGGSGSLPLDANHPVVDCRSYWPIGAPTLKEMLATAKIIEINTILDPAYR